MNNLFATTTIITTARRLAALACAAAALCTPAHADVLVSNIDVPIRGITVVSQDLWAAQAFSTDGSAYQLSSIEVLLGLLVGNPMLVAELHADAGGSPGLTLASIPLAGIVAGAPANLALPGSSVHLNAVAPYWIVLGAVGPGSFGWAYAEGNSQVGPGALGGFSYSTDAGASWGGVVTVDPYNLRVNVSAVPEPSTGGLWLAGLLLVGLQARRRLCL